MNFDKQLIALVTLFFLGSSLFVVSMLVQERQDLRRSAATGNASLSLPSNRPIDAGSEFTLPVMVDTDSQSVIAVDVIINFDKNHLRLVDITPHIQSGSLETFMPLDSNGQFKVAEVISKANSEGKVSFGSAAFRWSTEEVLSGFNGVLGPTNPLATLRFEALAAASRTDVGFQFTDGETTDSNLVSGTDDILASTVNCQVHIFQISPIVPTNTPIPTDTPILTPTPTPTGGLDCTPCIGGADKSSGDADCDGDVDMVDFEIWREEKFDHPQKDQQKPDWQADFSCDGYVDMIDFEIWRSTNFD
jgi:hypothetical protein